jgi:hypothetical protein
MNNTTDNQGAEQAPNTDQTAWTPGRWMRAAAYRRHVLTREYAAGLGDTAREGISEEDYATTMATLEQMARNLGWDEGQGEPGWGSRGAGGHRGYGHRGGCGRGSGENHRGHGKKARGKADKAEAKAAKRGEKAAAAPEA